MTDYLTCGQCFREFPLQGITNFIQHKKLECDDDDDLKLQSGLQCGYCPRGFVTAWALLMHAQIAHNLKIFLESAATSLLMKPVESEVEAASTANQITTSPAVKEMAKKDVQVSRSQTRTFSSEMNTNSSALNMLQDQGKGRKLTTTPSFKRNIFQEHHSAVEGRDGSSQKNIIVSESAIENTVAKLSPVKPAMFTNAANHNLTLAQSSTPKEKLSEHTSENTPKVPSLALSNPAMSLISNSINQSAVPTWVNKPLPLIKENDANVPVKSMPVIQSVPRTRSDFAATPVALNIPVSLKAPVVLQKVALMDNEETEVPGESSVSCRTDVDMNSKDSEDKEDDASMESECGESCKDQDCGVTVIPGSHEVLKECCSAVVPKKRKRHMMQKHMPFSWSSSRYASRKLLYRSRNSRPFSSQFLGKGSSSSTIYIDLEPNSLMGDDQSLSVDDPDQVKGFISSTSQIDSMTLSDAPMKGMTVEAGGKQRSLILKPGAVFSIPITYTIPASMQGSSKGTSAAGTEGVFSQPSLTIASTSRQNQSEAREIIRSTILSRRSEKLMQMEEGDRKSSGSRKDYGEKPFQCDKCTMAFNQRIHLKKHMSKHTGIKPYKCDECNYSTVERSHLKVHIRIHTGEKPFKCTYCEYATAQNSTLKIHLKRHHGGKMFQCNSCNKQFTQHDQLVDHVTEHEGSATPGVTMSSAEGTVSSLSTPLQPCDISDTPHIGDEEGGAAAGAGDGPQSVTTSRPQVTKTETIGQVTDQ